MEAKTSLELEGNPFFCFEKCQSFSILQGLKADCVKLNIQKTKAMASSLITSWQIDGETVETVTDFFSWSPKSLQMVTAAMK